MGARMRNPLLRTRRQAVRAAVAALALGGMLLLPSRAGAAEMTADVPEKEGPVVFDPASGSHFQLILPDHSFRGFTWEDAQARAHRRSRAGVPGRLAKVTTRETFQFLRRALPAREPFWIGLRYWCRFRTLQWDDGTLLERGGFQAWHPQWFRDPATTCETATHMKFMPVYMTAAQEGGLWQAAGDVKFMRGFVVEYPARPTDTAPRDP